MRRLALPLAIAACVVPGATARAQPPRPWFLIDPLGISLTATDAPEQQSYLVPAVEIVSMIAALNIASQLAGADWAKIGAGTLLDNLTRRPVFDEDPFTIDQLAHPWTGSVMFSAARSTGHGFWASGLYTFGGSVVWELVGENEPSSFNDQITTSMGGMLIGESLHRFGRSLLYSGYGTPGLVRRTAATLIDPVGAAHRAWWGDAWHNAVPPALYAHVGLGAAQTDPFDRDRGDPQLHLQFVAEHGLTGDAPFVPRRPFDHFELRGSLAASRADLDGTLYVRGLAVGTGYGTATGDFRGIGGLFAAYDFSNEDRVRHSQLGCGPGATAELRLGAGGYLQGSLVAYLVLWGAAGGESEDEGLRRDYHHGPGLAGLAELKLGRAGLGELRVTTRVYRIQGTFAQDPADETIAKTTLGGRIKLARHHAIGVEADRADRRARFAGAGMQLRGQSNEIRVYYALSTNGMFGGDH